MTEVGKSTSRSQEVANKFKKQHTTLMLTWFCGSGGWL